MLIDGVHAERRFEHVMWDWNGTLMDDAWLCLEILNGLLAERGLAQVSLPAYRRHFGFPVRRYYEQVGFDLVRESFEDLSVRFITTYNARRQECPLHPGTRETLAACAALGLTQSILSAYREDMLREVVAHYDLGGFFTRLSGSSDILGREKTEQGRRKLVALGIPPERILLVGDTTHDAEVAAALGVAAVLLPHGHQDPVQLSRTGCPLLSSLAEVPRFLVAKGARAGHDHRP